MYVRSQHESDKDQKERSLPYYPCSYLPILPEPQGVSWTTFFSASHWGRVLIFPTSWYQHRMVYLLDLETSLPDCDTLQNGQCFDPEMTIHWLDLTLRRK